MRATKTAVLRWCGWCRACGDRGMSTAEYAVGTIAAAAFGGLLYKIVTSSQVRSLLAQIIEKALRMTA